MSNEKTWADIIWDSKGFRKHFAVDELSKTKDELLDRISKFEIEDEDDYLVILDPFDIYEEWRTCSKDDLTDYFPYESNSFDPPYFVYNKELKRVIGITLEVAKVHTR